MPRSLFFALALAATAGCSESAIGPTEPEAGTLMVDASTGWTFVRLGDTATPVTVTDPGTSTAWDVAFFGTSVMLNGGAAGPGGVTGHCLCQNRGVSDAQVLAMSPGSELVDFEAVTSAQVPSAEDAWVSDALTPAIAGWYAYNLQTHQVAADPSKAWKVRLAEATSPGYAKLHVVGIEGGSQARAGRVTIEYAVQTAAGAPFGATKTAVLDGTNGRVYFDFARGTVTDANDWDIALDGWAIRINGGASGPGRAGAVLAGESFATMTDAGDAPAQIYKGDVYGGVFDANRWYRYNLTGSHDITPTFDVYLVRRGGVVYKVQLIGYYDPAGESRRITFRYAKIAG